MATHLKYNLINRGGERWRYHPVVDIKRLGITFRGATQQAHCDLWWFWYCENIPDELPPHIEAVAIGSIECIWVGLSQEQAERIRDYLDVYCIFSPLCKTSSKMREIKFKVWSKRINGFIENRNALRCFDEKIDCIQFEADEGVIIPLEYIGKKDKNGVEIYENFFVKFTQKEWTRVGVERIGLVTYDTEKCGFVVNSRYSSKAVDWSEMEVVGNLFQNPELLCELTNPA